MSSALSQDSLLNNSLTYPIFMKPLSKKAKMAIGWTILMTVIGTAMLHQWEFFAIGCASIAFLLVANHYDLLKDPEDKK